jgi:dipeptidyl aminopeptidase/acylaminoacyl peptidase
VRFAVALLVLLSIACEQPEALSAPSGPTRVSIVSDGDTLVGDIYMPDRRPRGGVPGVAIVHGSGTMPRSSHRFYIEPLNAMGIAVLVYDKRGVGESGGTYSPVGTADSIASIGQLARDASNAAKVLASHRGVDPKRIGLIGASQAGWIMPLAATHDPALSFLVVISGPAVTVGYEILHGRLTNELNPSAATVPPEDVARRLKTFAGPFGYDPAPTLATLKTPTLWLMGDRDINLPLKETIDALKALPQTSNGVITLIRYPEGDHSLFNRELGRALYWDDVRAWLTKHNIVRKP